MALLSRARTGANLQERVEGRRSRICKDEQPRGWSRICKGRRPTGRSRICKGPEGKGSPAQGVGRLGWRVPLLFLWRGALGAGAEVGGGEEGEILVYKDGAPEVGRAVEWRQTGRGRVI